MKACTVCKIEKPLDQFGVNRALKSGLTSQCKPCRNAANAKFDHRAWYEANKESCIQRAAEHKRKNPESVRRYLEKARADGRLQQGQRLWREANKERLAATKRAWQSANRQKLNALCEDWRVKNLDKMAAKEARRRAAKSSAQPPWANEFFIAQAYELAKIRTKVLGFKWHVDHIVPLKSRLVCGLHVENNLAVIPAVENIVKGNRYWPDMP